MRRQPLLPLCAAGSTMHGACCDAVSFWSATRATGGPRRAAARGATDRIKRGPCATARVRCPRQQDVVWPLAPGEVVPPAEAKKLTRRRGKLYPRKSPAGAVKIVSVVHVIYRWCSYSVHMVFYNVFLWCSLGTYVMFRNIFHYVHVVYTRCYMIFFGVHMVYTCDVLKCILRCLCGIYMRSSRATYVMFYDSPYGL
jgi:hypothetical protein